MSLNPSYALPHPPVRSRPRWSEQGRGRMDEWCDDIEHARELRAQAKQELSDLKDQAPAVDNLTQRLLLRRAMNHFGDSIEITFKRR